MKKFHILRYVEDTSPVLKKFTTVKALNEFVAKFQKKHKEPYSGWWVDYAVFNITDKQFVSYDSTVELK